MSDQLPPTNPNPSHHFLNTFVHHRPSFGRFDRKKSNLLQNRPISTGPDLFNSVSKSNFLKVCIPTCIFRHLEYIFIILVGFMFIFKKSSLI